MELLVDNKDKKVFIDDDKYYTMLDMGVYVGYRLRLWYENNPVIWKLMLLDEVSKNGQYKHIEALIDDKGDYSRLLVEINNVKRVILINNGCVYSDSIVSNFSFDGISDDSFYALDEEIYSDKIVPLDKYFGGTQSFYLKGKLYTGEVVNNNLVIDFLNKNNELVEFIESDKKIKTK